MLTALTSPRFSRSLARLAVPVTLSQASYLQRNSKDNASLMKGYMSKPQSGFHAVKVQQLEKFHEQLI